MIVIFSDLHYVEADRCLRCGSARSPASHRVVFASTIDQTLTEQAATPWRTRIALSAAEPRWRCCSAGGWPLRCCEQRGVHVLDAAPGELTPAVVAQFRRLRREDRL